MNASAMNLSAKMLNPADVLAIKERHPAAFERSLVKRFSVVLCVAIVALYAVYVSWFFAIGKVVSEGNWDIASTYLADWVSYEVRPDIDFRTGEIVVEFPKFSPLGSNPDPEWIITKSGIVTVKEKSNDAMMQSKPASSGSFMAPDASSGGAELSFMAPNSTATNMGSNEATSKTRDSNLVSTQKEGINQAEIVFSKTAHIIVTPSVVTLVNGTESVVLDVNPLDETVEPRGALPEWALQKREGEKIFANFGFAGRAEVRAKEVKIMRRFFGWENFFFDTNSHYWGKPFSEVASLAISGERISEGQSNASLMLDNFLNNAEWQHGDVYIKLLQTIVMAFVGTLFAVVIAFPLSFVAARNITPNRFLNQILKRFFDFLRSVDMLIWALFFTRAFGPGPLAGISAIFFTDTGTFGKLYSEALENIDDKQREGVRSVGASPAAVQRFGVLPQVLPVFASQALYFWESNIRSATIIGAVGAGGIGLKLWEAMRTNQDWENVFYMVILILIVIFMFDSASNALRSRLIGKQQS